MPTPQIRNNRNIKCPCGPISGGCAVDKTLYTYYKDHRARIPIMDNQFKRDEIIKQFDEENDNGP